MTHTVLEEDEGGATVELIRILSARRATRKERRRYGKKIASYTLEILPPLTDRRLATLKAMSGRPESEIDTSDVPEMTDAQVEECRMRRFYRPLKGQITARVDAMYWTGRKRGERILSRA